MVVKTNFGCCNLSHTKMLPHTNINIQQENNQICSQLNKKFSHTIIIIDYWKNSLEFLKAKVFQLWKNNMYPWQIEQTTHTPRIYHKNNGINIAIFFRKIGTLVDWLIDFSSYRFWVTVYVFETNKTNTAWINGNNHLMIIIMMMMMIVTFFLLFRQMEIFGVDGSTFI